jgi:hypothetical protein
MMLQASIQNLYEVSVDSCRNIQCVLHSIRSQATQQASNRPGLLQAWARTLQGASGLSRHRGMNKGRRIWPKMSLCQADREHASIPQIYKTMVISTMKWDHRLNLADKRWQADRGLALRALGVHRRRTRPGLAVGSIPKEITKPGKQTSVP